MMPDLRQTRALIVVFAMPGCGACDEYLPMFLDQVEALRRQGAPFNVWTPGKAFAPREIPVMLYDAAAESEELQAFADQLGITATPTTCLMTRHGTTKIEGAVDEAAVQGLLGAALRANR